MTEGICVKISGFEQVFASRREVLRGMAGGGLALGLPCGGAAAQQAVTPGGASRVLALTLGPLAVPAKPGAAPSPMLAVNGAIPGPVLRVPRGAPVTLRVQNSLDQPTALHIHGYRGANRAEQVPGLTGEPIPPGGVREWQIETPDAGTYLYLPVLQGRAAEQLERGLGGAFIVTEPDAPAVDHDVVLLLDDIRLNDAGLLAGDFGDRLDAARAGRLGNLLLVNGRTLAEELVVRPNARLRLRFGSLANARVMPLKFENARATVLAIDGQACDPFDPLKRTVVLLPGSRYEVMVDAPAVAGQEARILVAAGAGLPIIRIRSEGPALPERPPVGRLPLNDLPASIRLQNAARSEIAITGGAPRPDKPDAPAPAPETWLGQFPPGKPLFQINGGFNTGFAAKPVLSVRRGAPVVLALTNRTRWPQVLSVHGHVFRLLHPMDDGWEPYFLDTLHLPPGTTSRIAFDAVNPGKWAIRSTIAEHYDAGVATWFEVLP